MQRRRLGTSDFNQDLSVVGFGAWAAGGPDWSQGLGPQADSDSIASIYRAVEGGVNWIDTAPAYGLGHSEEVVGRALRDLPVNDRPMVFTKVGRRWNAQGEFENVDRAADIRAQLEGSLGRLGLERVDLLQIHWPQFFGLPLEEVWGVLLDLQRQGLTQCVGVSNFSVEQLSACEAVGHVDSLQPPLSAINRRAGEAIIPWCAANGTGVIVYSPMESGLLSGAFSVKRVAALPDNDVRKAGRAPFSEPNLSDNLSVAAALEQVARRYGVPTPAVAVAWTLAWPGVTGAIVGARRPSQVDDWLQAGSLELTDADLDVVADAIARRGVGQGLPRPPARS